MPIVKTIVIVLFLCTFLFAADSTTTQAKPMFKMTNGALVVVDTVDYMIIINEGNKQDTLTLTAKTIFSRYSTPIEVSELKIGDNVTVHYRELSGNKTAIRVVVRDKQTNATIASQDSSSSQ